MIRWNGFKKNSPLEAKDTTSGNVPTADDPVDYPPAGEMESGTSLFCGKIHTIMFPNQLGAVFGFQVLYFFDWFISLLPYTILIPLPGSLLTVNFCKPDPETHGVG